jgi:crotonobetainyl-CoA:carnitine CoA-transferase CaiB-like acyl-CoA transferase
MIIAVGNDSQFARLADVLGLPDLAADPRFATNAARVENREQLKVTLETALAERSADDWQESITAAGVPCGPINDIAQGFALAERLGLHPVVELDDPRRDGLQSQVANPLSYSATPVAYRSAPPLVDEDRAAVLTLLGLAAE